MLGIGWDIEKKSRFFGTEFQNGMERRREEG